MQVVHAGARTERVEAAAHGAAPQPTHHEAQRDALAAEFPDAVLMAASVPADVLRLHGLIRDFFERFMEEETFLVPYDRQAKVWLLHERCRVLEERYEEDGAHVRVLAPAGVLGGLRREIQP